MDGLNKATCLLQITEATNPAGQFMQCNSNWEWTCRISDSVLVSDMNVSDGQLQVFNNICEEFLCKSVFFCIFSNFWKVQQSTEITC